MVYVAQRHRVEEKYQMAANVAAQGVNGGGVSSSMAHISSKIATAANNGGSIISAKHQRHAAGNISSSVAQASTAGSAYNVTAAAWRHQHQSEMKRNKNNSMAYQRPRNGVS